MRRSEDALLPHDRQPEADMTDDSLLTIKALRERGWTPTLITRLLGEPDLLKHNPRFTKVPMRLYRAARVAATEQMPEFLAGQTRAQARAAAARQTTELQRDTLLRLIDRMVIGVQRLPIAQIRQCAGSAYEIPNETAVGRAASQHSLDRIAVNYILHRLTHYDAMLEAMGGRLGVAVAAPRIRRKVFEAIAAAYPELAAECDRQAPPRQSHNGELCGPSEIP